MEVVSFISSVAKHTHIPLAGRRLSQLIGSTLALDYLRAGELSLERNVILGIDTTFAQVLRPYRLFRIRRPARFDLPHLQLFIRELFGGQSCDE